MSILIKQGDEYYEIPDNVLAKSKVTKADFEKGLREMAANVADQTGGWKDYCNFIDLSACKIHDLER